MYLIVYAVRPSITDSGDTPVYTILEGDTVTLECPVVGVPDPEIQWQRDNRVIELSQNSQLEIIAVGQVSASAGLNYIYIYLKGYI